MNTADAYTFKGYTSGMVATQGNRLAKVMFKVDKKSGVKRDSVCAELPLVLPAAIKSNVDVLCEAIRFWVEDTQDAIVREKVLAGASAVTAGEISLEAVAAYMRESLASGRLTSVAVESWYAENMEALLAEALAQKLGISSEAPEADPAKTAALLQVLEVYKKKIVALASGRTRYTKEEAQKLLRAFEVTSLAGSQDDDIASKLVQRLRVMMQDDSAVDLLAL